MTTARHPETAPSPGSAAPAAPAGVRDTPPSSMLRFSGGGLAVGSATYGVAWLVLGEGVDQGRFAMDLLGIALQLGIFGLLLALWRTHGTGVERFGRGLLVVEAVILAVATVQSGFAASAGGGEWGTVATVLDPAWPLSMLGMVVVGIAVAVAGRWRGILRVWAPVAGSWLVAGLGVSMLVPGDATTIVGGLHFLLGYTVLGVLLAVRPDLTARA
ncbi:hypothetical protein [Actinomycetospora aeridis]|uniref:DUF4386 family protein n=1 Tax=Actinomycetospora aeridis TaxID=3129231 RepID=A0ABU8N448_9PSEU